MTLDPAQYQQSCLRNSQDPTACPKLNLSPQPNQLRNATQSRVEGKRVQSLTQTLAESQQPYFRNFAPETTTQSDQTTEQKRREEKFLPARGGGAAYLRWRQ